jgi:hypothetical protein
VLNLSGQLGGNDVTLTVSGGTINDTGPNGELYSEFATFSGGTSVVRKLTAELGYVQISNNASLTITGSATWGPGYDWKMLGTDFTFKTAGTPTWSAGSLTIVNGGAWTFC